MTRTGDKRVQKGYTGQSAASVTFKYYIHDTAKGYALEMSGPFTESSVSELSCCWQTAKTTLNDRTLTLDLRGISSVDEGARQWLASMAQDGAKCLPDSFLLESLAGLPGRDQQQLESPRLSLFTRLFRVCPKPAISNQHGKG